jgi:glycosyltransferase involved in cell wall biosynthesis
MHVGLNLVYLVPGEIGGMETYARELIPALAAERPDMRITSFVNTSMNAGPWDDAGEVVMLPVDSRSRVQWVMGEQRHLPGAASRAGVDLVHSFATTAPLRGPFRRVTTVHDLIYKRFPDAHFGLRSLGMRALVPAAVRRSHRVIADSESTRHDMRELLGTPDSKIDVVPLGLGTTPSSEATSEEELRAQLDLGERQLLLTLSAKRPVKNLKRLIDALASIPAERRPVLVMPGYPTPYEAELREHASAAGVADDIRWLGWSSDAELEGLYAMAACFVFPSLYEGFGLPVLEAMRRGVPVACSDRSSLPEVAGDAAALFDPESPAAIAGAVERVLGDPAEAQRMRKAGLEQAGKFSWDRAARETLASYDRALDRE